MMTPSVNVHAASVLTGDTLSVILTCAHPITASALVLLLFAFPLPLSSFTSWSAITFNLKIASAFVF